MASRKKIKKVVVVGLGYIGLPTLVAIQKSGLYETVGFDINRGKIKQIRAGISPIDDLEVKDYIKRKVLKVSDKDKILIDSDVFIVCVPTPVLDDFTPDYRPVISASETVAKYLKKSSHFVLESTVSPGTCEEIVLPILEEKSGLRAGKDFNIAP